MRGSGKGSGEQPQLTSKAALAMAPNCTASRKPEAAEVDPRLPALQEQGKCVGAPDAPCRSNSNESTASTSSGLTSASLYSGDCLRLYTKRRQRKQKNEEQLKRFLQEHTFSQSVDKPKVSRFSFMREVLYPIHVAAMLGDAQMVRLLMQAGADLKQRTSKGRTAADLAFEKDVSGSHRDVLDLLTGEVQVMSLRDFMSPHFA